MGSIAIEYCTQRQAKSYGQFICTRKNEEDMKLEYRRLTKELRAKHARGKLAVFFVKQLGFNIYYFDNNQGLSKMGTIKWSIDRWTDGELNKYIKKNRDLLEILHYGTPAYDMVFQQVKLCEAILKDRKEYRNKKRIPQGIHQSTLYETGG